MVNKSLLDKLAKNSTLKHTAILNDSEIFNNKETALTPIPAVNVALTACVDEGFGPGMYMFCGNSKMYKTGYGLLMLKSYLDQYPDAVCIFFDNEFGAPKAYWESYEIDMNRVLHVPFTNIEQLTFEMMKQLDVIERGERVFLFVDSIGNAASRREVENALSESGKVDMQRAKNLKGLFRMITPHLTLKNLPLVVVNHIYMEQGAMYPKAIVSGGSGPYLSADEIFIVTRQTDKDGKEIAGYNFVLNVEKSRHVKEKSKIPISISYGSGIDKYSGVLDWAIEAGFIIQAGAWYQLVDLETGEVKEKKIRASAIDGSVLDPILKNQKFKDFIKNKYKVSSNKMIQREDDSTDNEADEYLETVEEE